jgi:integrase
MPLSDVAIRAAKPREKAYKMFDERGLFLLVTTTGSKLWRFKYTFEGREKLLSFGNFPDVPLRVARDKRDEARRTLSAAEPVDPSAKRQAERAARADTFGLIAQEWLQTKRKVLSEGTWERDNHQLTRVVGPYLGNRPIASIEAAELFSVLRRLEARGVRDTTHRVRAVVGRVFRYAIATGRAKHDISMDLRGALAPRATRNHPSITDPVKVGQLLRAIDGYEGQVATHAALRIAPYVFVRPGELRAAEWSEFNLDACEWRIPAERMKMGELHIVPLASQVVAILRELQPVTGGGRYCFPALGSGMRPLSDNTLNAALRRLGYSGDEHTAHGFRSMASTLLNEQGWHPDLIELQLAHAERNKVRAAYNKAQRLGERRTMMQAWADYIDGLKAGGQITPVHHKNGMQQVS